MYGISIDHEIKTITITKKFAKLTKNFASDESKELGEAMRQYPNYKLVTHTIKKATNKVTYEGLNYKTMKDYFTANKADQAKQLCDKLDEMRGLKNGKRDVTMMVCSYAAIKAWFFSVCSEIESHNEEIQELCKKSKKEQRMNAPAEESTIQSGNSETTTSAETDIKTFTPTEVIKNTSLSVQEADRKVS